MREKIIRWAVYFLLHIFVNCVFWKLLEAKNILLLTPDARTIWGMLRITLVVFFSHLIWILVSKNKTELAIITIVIALPRSLLLLAKDGLYALSLFNEVYCLPYYLTMQIQGEGILSINGNIVLIILIVVYVICLNFSSKYLFFQMKRRFFSSHFNQ